MRRLAALGLTLIAFACRQGSPQDGAWAGVSKVDGVSDEHGPDIVADAELKSYLPERIGDRPGGESLGSTTRIGGRALSEARRSYPGPGTAVELTISDARLSPRVVQTITGMGSEEPTAGAEPSRLVLPGAVGYSRYDEVERMALAQVVIAGRFVASATVSGAQGPDEAAEALRAVDTLKLSRMAQAE